jgi:hypothetical protein
MVMYVFIFLVGCILPVALPGPSQAKESNRDKTGTTGFEKWTELLETMEKQEPALAGSFDTERAGFEPAVRYYPHADLANRCFRPLSHLSGLASIHCIITASLPNCKTIDSDSTSAENSDVRDERHSTTTRLSRCTSST